MSPETLGKFPNPIKIRDKLLIQISLPLFLFPTNFMHPKCHNLHLELVNIFSEAQMKPQEIISMAEWENKDCLLN